MCPAHRLKPRLAQLRRPTSVCPAASLARAAAVLRVPQAQLAQALRVGLPAPANYLCPSQLPTPQLLPPKPIGAPQGCYPSSSFAKNFGFLREMGRVVTFSLNYFRDALVASPTQHRTFDLYGLLIHGANGERNSYFAFFGESPIAP